MKRPFVSCIMPHLGRSGIYGEAGLHSFFLQSYAPLRMERDSTPEATLGSLRNALVRGSRSDIIAHFDDDDFSRNDRISVSVDAIERGAELVGSSLCYFIDFASQKAWLYDGAKNADAPFLLGTTFCYTRRLFDELGGFHSFMPYGEDGDFQTRARAIGAKVCDLRLPALVVATIHPGNTCRRVTTDRAWSLADFEKVEALTK